MNAKLIKISNPNLVYLQKTVIVGCVVIAFVVFGYILYLNNYLGQHSPKEPQIATGEIIETYVNHGTRIYITQYEEIETKSILPCSFLFLLFIAFLLNKKWKHFSPFKDS